MPQDNSVTLHYIDKLHAALVSTGKALNRDILMMTLLSLLAAALSAGIVQPKGEISVGGLGITLSATLVQLSAVWLVCLLYIHHVGLMKHETHLRETIQRLYGELGFIDLSMHNEELSFLEFPNVLTTIISKENIFLGKLHWPVVLLLAAVVELLPLAAVGYIFYRMIIAHGPKWWLVLSAVVVVGLMTLYLVAFFKETTPLPATPADGEDAATE